MTRTKTNQVPDAGRLGQFTQECPSCEGMMPAAAVWVRPWKISKVKGATYERLVSMSCPHCGYQQKRRETIPEGSFMAHAKLSGDR